MSSAALRLTHTPKHRPTAMASAPEKPVVLAGRSAGRDYISMPSEAEYRPMGIAMGKGGARYVSDSKKGRIWKIFYDN